MIGRRNVFLGSVFILTGILFLAVNADLISVGDIFSNYWAFLFVIVPGLIMHLAFFSRVSPAGILVPGGILLTIGTVLQISSTFDIWGVTWPGYILATAVGLFELYIFGHKSKGLLIPVFILGFISMIFFSFTLGNYIDSRLRNYFIAAVFIILCLYVIFNKGTKNK